MGEEHRVGAAAWHREAAASQKLWDESPQMASLRAKAPELVGFFSRCPWGHLQYWLGEMASDEGRE